jgi:hypothetical protein
VRLILVKLALNLKVDVLLFYRCVLRRLFSLAVLCLVWGLIFHEGGAYMGELNHVFVGNGSYLRKYTQFLRGGFTFPLIG